MAEGLLPSRPLHCGLLPPFYWPGCIKGPKTFLPSQRAAVGLQPASCLVTPTWLGTQVLVSRLWPSCTQHGMLHPPTTPQAALGHSCHFLPLVPTSNCRCVPSSVQALPLCESVSGTALCLPGRSAGKPESPLSFTHHSTFIRKPRPSNVKDERTRLRSRPCTQTQCPAVSPSSGHGLTSHFTPQAGGLWAPLHHGRGRCAHHRSVRQEGLLSQRELGDEGQDLSLDVEGTWRVGSPLSRFTT